MCRRWQHLNGHFQDTKAAEELKPYLQGFCEGCCAGIANLVIVEVQDLEGVIFLQEIGKKSIERAWLGGLTGVERHGK
jgi:hypothetical protein